MDHDKDFVSAMPYGVSVESDPPAVRRTPRYYSWIDVCDCLLVTLTRRSSLLFVASPIPTQGRIALEGFSYWTLRRQRCAGQGPHGDLPQQLLHQRKLPQPIFPLWNWPVSYLPPLCPEIPHSPTIPVFTTTITIMSEMELTPVSVPSFWLRTMSLSPPRKLCFLRMAVSLLPEATISVAL